MKKLRILALAVLLAFAAPAFIAGPIGCTSTSRSAYTTLASVGKAVDIAEREYLDRVIDGRVGTNDFTRIQAGYSAFQVAYRASVAVSMNDTNALAPASLAAAGAKLINDIYIAKGGK